MVEFIILNNVNNNTGTVNAPVNIQNGTLNAPVNIQIGNHISNATPHEPQKKNEIKINWNGLFAEIKNRIKKKIVSSVFITIALLKYALKGGRDSDKGSDRLDRETEKEENRSKKAEEDK